jgi:branched-chain amino acid transport system permease protein
MSGLKTFNRQRLLKTAAVLAALVLVNVLAPLLCNTYHMSIINTCLFYFICIVGINVLLGLGGLLGLCSITFMGVGAFVCGRLATTFGWPTVPAFIAGTIAAGIISFLLGIPLLRLKGTFFTFGTIALIFIGNTIFMNWNEMTGGPNGTYGIPPLSIFGMKIDTYFKWFPLLCLIVVLVMFLYSRIKNSSLGRSLMAIRDSEIAALTLGVNVYRTKIIGFTISGALAGFSGALYALHNGVVSASLFTFDVQLSLLMMVMLGGVQHASGSLIGAFLVKVLPELSRVMDKYLNTFYGVMIVLLMIFMPMGITGIYDMVYKALSRKLKKRQTE